MSQATETLASDIHSDVAVALATVKQQQDPIIAPTVLNIPLALDCNLREMQTIGDRRHSVQGR